MKRLRNCKKFIQN